MKKSETLLKVSAPGRICLAGEHCDYARGKCIGLNLAQKTIVKGRLRNDSVFDIGSRLGDEIFRLKFSGNTKHIVWDSPLRYCQAIIKTLLAQGYRIGGADLEISSDIPIGKGLSSSAALCVATVKFFNTACELKLSFGEIGEIAYIAEHDVLAIGCGRLDQIVSVYQSLLLLDFSNGIKPKVAAIKPRGKLYLVVVIPLVVNRDTQGILAVVNKAYFKPKTRDERGFKKALDELIPRFVVEPMKNALQETDAARVGSLMRKNQELYNDYFAPLSKYLDSADLKKCLDAAKNNGSLGEKWTGLGGFGSFICLADSYSGREKLKQAMVKKLKFVLEFIDVDISPSLG